MKWEELTKIFMMFSNCDKLFGLHDLYKINSALYGLKVYCLIIMIMSLATVTYGYYSYFI